MEKKKSKKILLICGIILIIIMAGVIFATITSKSGKNNTESGNDKSTNEQQYTTLLKDVVKIGDYVQYEPIEEEFTLEKSETGYDIDQKFKTSKYTGNWLSLIHI